MKNDYPVKLQACSILLQLIVDMVNARVALDLWAYKDGSSSK